MTHRVRPPARAAAGAFIFLAGFFFFAATVWSHGSDSEVRLLGQRAGAYDVTVRTAPQQPGVGPLHVQVQLIDPKALAYVDRASVTAVARLRGGRILKAGLVRSQYREPWHEMDLRLTKSGAWDVRLMIDGPLGSENLSFCVDVSDETADALPNSHS